MTSRYLGLFRSAAVGGLASLLLSACGGGGGGGGGNQPPPADVTISGRITFDRIPFDTTPGNGSEPSGHCRVAGAPGDGAGDRCEQQQRARHRDDRPQRQLLGDGAVQPQSVHPRARGDGQDRRPRRPGISASRNNTNSDALYALDGAAASSGTANSTRNLHAPTGFGREQLHGRAGSRAVRDPRQRVSRQRAGR